MAHTIAVYNFKGGVGKTTSSYFLALNWAKTFKTLIVDCDPQKNLTSAILKNTSTTRTVFTYITATLHNTQPEIQPIEVTSHLHIIPGDHRMVDLESNNQFIEFGLGIIQKMLQSVGHQYDLILLDCPSYFGKTVKFFIGNAGYLLIPATPDSFSLRGVLELIRQMKDIEKLRRLNVLGVFYNRYRVNFRHHKKMRVLARRVFGSLYLDSPVRNTVRVSESLDSKGFIHHQDNQSQMLLDYQRLGVKILERLFKTTTQLTETSTDFSGAQKNRRILSAGF